MKFYYIKIIIFISLFYFFIPGYGQDTNKVINDQIVILRQFLLKNLPEGTPWYYKSNNKQQKIAMRRLIEKSVPLKYFKPYRLIKLIYWNPAAGFPGSIIHDFRVLFHPEKNQFVMSTIQRIKNHRQNSPLDISKLDLSEIQNYIEEFVSLFTLLDNYGFNITKIAVEKPLHVSIVYEKTRSTHKKQINEIMIFDDEGVLLKSKLLECLKGNGLSKGRW